MLFFLFLLLTGGMVILLGGVSSGIMYLCGLVGIEISYLSIILTTLLTVGYLLGLEKWYKSIYDSMFLTYKNLTFIEKLKNRAIIFSLMSIHYYGLKWVYTESSSLLHFIVLVIPLSILLGLVIKACMDESYSIKLTKEGHDMIYGHDD